MPRSISAGILSGLLLALPGSGLGQTAFEGLQGWYHPHSLSLAGGGASLASLENDRTNPAALAGLQPQFRLGLLRYPAGVASQSAVLLLSRPGQELALGLRHLGYGRFSGRDEDNRSLGDYSAGDTWLTVAVARRIWGGRLAGGLSGGIFLSRLGSYQALALTLTPGLLLQGERTRVGLSLTNLGRVLSDYTTYRERLPVALLASLSRRLAHLPLDLGVDLVYYRLQRQAALHLGGVFQLPWNLQLKWGTSSQRLGLPPARRSIIMAATGLGLSYAAAPYHFEMGAYFYGLGGWIGGLGLGVEF